MALTGPSQPKDKRPDISKVNLPEAPAPAVAPLADLQTSRPRPQGPLVGPDGQPILFAQFGAIREGISAVGSAAGVGRGSSYQQPSVSIGGVTIRAPQRSRNPLAKSTGVIDIADTQGGNLSLKGDSSEFHAFVQTIAELPTKDFSMRYDYEKKGFVFMRCGQPIEGAFVACDREKLKANDKEELKRVTAAIGRVRESGAFGSAQQCASEPQPSTAPASPQQTGGGPRGGNRQAPPPNSTAPAPSASPKVEAVGVSIEMTKGSDKIELNTKDNPECTGLIVKIRKAIELGATVKFDPDKNELVFSYKKGVVSSTDRRPFSVAGLGSEKLDERVAAAEAASKAVQDFIDTKLAKK